MGASWQAFYAHLCAASIIRAMPETEIPPRYAGGSLLNTGKAALTAACKSNAIGGLFNMLCLGLTLWNWLNHKAWTANGVLDTGGGRSR